jgi:hypothetical protein
VAEDEKCTECAFGDEQNSCCDGSFACAISAWTGEEGPCDEHGHQRGADAGERAVRELDDGSEAGMVRQDFAVAERPVCSAACAGAGGANDSAFQDDQHHEADDEGSEGRQTAAAADRGKNSAHISIVVVSCWRARERVHWRA